MINAMHAASSRPITIYAIVRFILARNSSDCKDSGHSLIILDFYSRHKVKNITPLKL